MVVHPWGAGQVCDEAQPSLHDEYHDDLDLVQSQTWSFTPGERGKFVMKPSLIVWGQGFSNNTSGGKKKEFPLRLVAEGTLGSIQVSVDVC